MKRHLIRIFMTALIVAGLFSAAAFADDPPTVVASGTCGTNATWTMDSEGTLTISGSGEMDNNYSDMYGSNPAPWIVDYRSAIKKSCYRWWNYQYQWCGFCVLRSAFPNQYR